MARLLDPRDAADAVAAALARDWPVAVLAEASNDGAYEKSVPLHPGVTSRTRGQDIDWGAWQEWSDSWHQSEAALPAGCVLSRGAPHDSGAPHALNVRTIRSATALVSAFGAPPPDVDLVRALSIARTLVERVQDLTPRQLRQVAALDDAEVEVMVASIDWLHANRHDLTGLTDRQLPVPGMHTKWLAKHGSLLQSLVGWDVRATLRSRVAVAHLTYVDPGYLASGSRRHDAWTAGDTHELAYQPSVVVVVENRDCRLDFPPMDSTVVVEGAGKAATWLLAAVPWLRAADHVIYWGDLDADGFEILDRFRTAMAQPTADRLRSRPVTSILMDARALDSYRPLGVRRDRNGAPIHRTAVRLPSLTDGERTAYYELTTSADVSVRRIEQERIPLVDAARAVHSVTAPRSPGPGVEV